MRLFLSTLLTLLLFACSDNEKTNVDSNNKDNELGELVDRVHHCSTLEVAEYTMLKIVSFDDSSIINIIGHKFSLPGERKLMIPIEVKTKIYIDLNYVTKDDITIDSTTIYISLPSPRIEIYSTKEDHNLERESVSWYRSHFTEQERKMFIKQGIEEIKKNIPSMDIDHIAKRNSEKLIQPIIDKAGDKRQVCITFKKPSIFCPSDKD